jgi:hypothetical protein
MSVRAKFPRKRSYKVERSESIVRRWHGRASIDPPKAQFPGKRIFTGRWLRRPYLRWGVDGTHSFDLNSRCREDRFEHKWYIESSRESAMDEHDEQIEKILGTYVFNGKTSTKG